MSIIDKNRVYELPTPLILALQSERGELVNLTISLVKKGELKIDEALAVELLTLIGNQIHELREAKTKLFRLEEEIEFLDDETAKALATLGKVRASVKDADAVLKDLDIEEDE